VSRVAFNKTLAIVVATVITVSAAQAATAYSVNGPDVGESAFVSTTFLATHQEPHPKSRFKGLDAENRQMVFDTQIAGFKAVKPASESGCNTQGYGCSRVFVTFDEPSLPASTNHAVGNVITVPAPASLALVGLSVLALCLACCRRIA